MCGKVDVMMKFSAFLSFYMVDEGALDTIGLFLFVSQFAIWNSDFFGMALNFIHLYR